MTRRHRAHILILSDNDCSEKLLRLGELRDDLPVECLAPEDAVPDVAGAIPPGMKAITIRWGTGNRSEHFVYKNRFLLRKNKEHISSFFDSIGASRGTKLVIQKIGPFEFAVCELASNK